MNSNAPRTRVDTLIIGAGLTGLSAGYHLTKHGEQVIILEAATRVGGAVGSVIEAGWLRELGPNSLMQTEALAQLLSKLDLSAETIEANPIAKKRFVAKNGHSVALPANPLELLSSPLFSLGDLFHLAREPWIKPAKTEESIAQFVRRRLGQGFLDWAVDPFVSGVYAGDPNRLSARAAIPKIYAMEQENGSLIRAGIARMKAAKANPAPLTQPAKGKLLSFKKGLQTLTDALACAITTSGKGEIHTNSPCSGIIPNADNSWTVHTELGDSFTCKNLILTVPAAVAARLLEPFDLALAEQLNPIEYPPIASVVMGFNRDQVAHPLDGFGLLIPSKEHKQTLGVLFSSTLFPDRTPLGKVMLTAFIGGRQKPQAAEGTEDEILGRVLRDLSPLLGIQGQPEFLRIQAWPRAIPQYELGYLTRIEAISTLAARWPNLHLAGNWRGGIAVGDCLINGQKLAEQLAATGA
ncbi:MAG: protoporphyrinogen oxidase [Halothiobacillaceae bacterium]|nr:protoporphyrinogen oxidase [Halothiobacillaceae bacterium]